MLPQELGIHLHTKSMGGLSIKKTQDMNRALVAKMSWEIVSNVDKVWVKVFQKKYVKKRNFMKVPMPKSTSWSCQSILAVEMYWKMGFAIELAMA